MKHKFYFGLLLIFFLVNTNLFAQNFWVPDASFRNKLKQMYPSCFTAQDSLITTCNLIQNETSLVISNFSIVSNVSINGIQFFVSLDTLICSAIQITSLPSLPTTLTYLDCHFCQLTSLPNLPASLTYLDCSTNLLTSLPNLPASLDYLVCNNNQLSSLPFLPASLSVLECWVNQLTSLPSLPGTLTFLGCGHNQLTSLPNLPSFIYSIDCSRNQLTSLPSLPSSLTKLICYQNQLTSLPSLPASLTELSCLGNQLTSLPSLPATFLILNCGYNQLTSLPKIPGRTTKVDCRNNPITCFPEIAARTWFYVWSSIIIDSTLISCIPNTGTFPLSVVHSTQPLPVCSPGNNNCNYNYTFGNVFLDMNINGTKDGSEAGLEIPVYCTGNSGIFPDSNGVFYFASDTGNITFQLMVPPYYAPSTPISNTIHVVGGIVDTVNFGIHPLVNIADLNVDLIAVGFLRPGFKAAYKFSYKNVGTDTITNVKLKFLKPALLSNLLSIPVANTISGDTLIWNITSLNPFEHGSIQIKDSVFANAILGNTAMAFAWIEPIAGDTTPINNSCISKNVIRGSFDPNDKSASPEIVAPNSTENLEYTIRFQNTGTDTAFTVVIFDTLSNLLDVYSMEMISASHPYQLSITNRIAKWIFSSILLPDSNTNELESHGFLKFRIKPKPGLMLNDSIPNQAKIFFDYNASVSTNTIIVNVNFVGVHELKTDELKIFPNPVQESLRIVNQQAGALGKIELINASGKVLETKTISNSTYTWNIQQLPAGTYILKGQGWGQKVVKE